MKLSVGSTRIVFLAGNYAFKFPRLLHCIFGIVLNLASFFKHWKWYYISESYVRPWTWLRKGLNQNQSEYRCWKSCKASFLAPTYFSIGIVNIQKRFAGEHPSWKEMETLVQQISLRTEYQPWRVDPHCFGPDNFIKSSDGIKIVDYGNSSEQPLRFTDFILRWQKEINEVLSASKTPSA